MPENGGRFARKEVGRDEASKPEGRLGGPSVGASGDGLRDEALSAGDSWVLAVLDVPAGPEAVQQCFVGFPAAGA